MKEKRGLSGIYFRFQEEDGSWGNRVFEDLPREEQEKILEKVDKEYLVKLALMLADTITSIGDQLDIMVSH